MGPHLEAGLSLPHTQAPGVGPSSSQTVSTLCKSPAGPTPHPCTRAPAYIQLTLVLVFWACFAYPCVPQALGPAGMWELNLSPPGQSRCWCRHLGLRDWGSGCCSGPC